MDSFGTKLKREREKRKVTLDDVSISTKIGTRFLRAREADRFQELPGGICNKGFVRAYARHLGLDEEQILSDFALASGEEDPQQPGPAEHAAKPKVRQEGEASEPSSLPWGWLVVALIVVGFALAFWGIYSHDKRENQTTTTAPASLPAKPLAPPSGAPQPSSVTKPEARPPVPAEVLGAAPTRTSPTASTAGFAVTLHLRKDSWVSITADGQQTTRGILPANSQRTIRARNQIVVRTGNAAATDLAFNGAAVPASGAENEVKAFAFDAHGLQPSSAPATNP